MKISLGIILFWLFGASPATAYELLPTVIDRPYDVVFVDSETDMQQVYSGTLAGFPVMYGIEVTATTTLQLALEQQYRGSDPLPLALMVVRQEPKDAGVTEIVRFTPGVAGWEKRKDAAYGLTLLKSDVLSQPLGPGSYRIEVSTPNNQAKYLLTFGEETETMGYFETLSRVRGVQKHFGYSVFKMLTSSLVYYPLGIFLLLYLISRTWRYRNVITHVS